MAEVGSDDLERPEREDGSPEVSWDLPVAAPEEFGETRLESGVTDPIWGERQAVDEVHDHKAGFREPDGRGEPGRMGRLRDGQLVPAHHPVVGEILAEADDVDPGAIFHR